MSSSKECREFADECMGWAKTARSEREQRIFLQMAETWLRAAIAAERRERAPRRRDASSSQQSDSAPTYTSG
jgi:hypothetical protein